ncbi:MAG: AbrB/MazE/SpoVT family DNA-binding domain-containing protein [Terracidiphilus sp.]
MSTFAISAENDTKQQSVTSRVNDNGRIVIPANIRKSMGLRPGDVVVMSLEDGVLRIESHLSRIRRIQEEFKKFATPGTLASDELIAERREEARREMEESLE